MTGRNSLIILSALLLSEASGVSKLTGVLDTTVAAYAQPLAPPLSTPSVDVAHPREERWVGVFLPKDRSNVVFASAGHTYEITGLIERQLLKEVSKECTVTGRTFDGSTIEVIKVEPVRPTSR